MLDPFDQKKSSILAEINSTLADTPDLSPKGSIDEICIPIMNLINSHPDMVTTSSCSGRVSVFLEGIKDAEADSVQIGAKGNQGRWLFVSHEPEKLHNWHTLIAFSYQPQEQQLYALIDNDTRYILYKFEPLILHVKCRDLATANRLYSTAMGCGFRESGIGSNNIVGIRTLIKLDVPIGFLRGAGDAEELVSFVSEDYLQVLTKLSHDRFKENFRKLDGIFRAIEQMDTVPAKVSVETKEERKERKIREGMARRDAVRAQKEDKRRQDLLLQQQSPTKQAESI